MKIPNSDHQATAKYDLRANCLSQLGAVSQSVAGIAPTATLAMIVPLLVRTSGPLAWFPFLIAMIGVLCLASQINLFVRTNPGPGSLYSYVYGAFGLVPGLMTGWSLLIAYIATAGAAVAGFALSVSSILEFPIPASRWLVGGIALASVAAGAFLAYRDVNLSVRVMLAIEFSSVGLMLLLFCLPGAGSVWHASFSPINFSHDTFEKIGGGLVLAVFSFVGFESAASLGSEVTTASKAIPRALRIAVVVSGLLFMFAAWAEFQGFQNLNTLDGDAAPLQILATARGMPRLSGFLLAGSAASFLACILACFTAASRTLMQMSRDGHVASGFGRVHARYRTPHVAIAATAPTVILPLLLLLGFNARVLDIYEWLGVFATVGFVIAYLMIVAAAVHTAYVQQSISIPSFSIAIMGGAIMAIALWGSLFASTGWLAACLLSSFAVALMFGVGVSLFAARRAFES